MLSGTYDDLQGMNHGQIKVQVILTWNSIEIFNGNTTTVFPSGVYKRI